MIDIKKITNGELDDTKVWVCDLRYTDFSKKAARNLKPSLVMIRGNDETTKTIYYSSSHFVSLNKIGEPINSKIIPLFDNTGYRSFRGIPINVFETEEECRSFYKSQVKTAIKGLINYKASLTISVDAKIFELEKELL